MLGLKRGRKRRFDVIFGYSIMYVVVVVVVFVDMIS